MMWKKEDIISFKRKNWKLFKNNINEKKFKTNDIKIKVKEFGTALVVKNIINQEELDKFLISDSWVKQL